jgi:hypothetical protein
MEITPTSEITRQDSLLDAEHPARKSKPKIVIPALGLFALLVLAALFFGDRGYYEADSIFTLFGAVNLEKAKAGEIDLYRYHHQPLAYEFLHFAHQLTGSFRLLYVLPALFCAAGIALLTVAVYFAAEGRIHFAFCALIVASQPELFYTLLYPNTTTYGLFFLGASLALLFHPDEFHVRGAGLNPLLIALLYTTGCFFRFDFVLAGPLLLVLVGNKSKWGRETLFFAGTCALLLVFFFLIGILNFKELLALGEEHEVLFAVHAWTSDKQIAVALTLMSGWIWLIAVLLVAVAIGDVVRRRYFIPTILILVSAAPLLYPMRFLFSPKYLVPFSMFLPLLFAGALRASLDWPARRASRSLFIAFGLLVIISYAVALDLRSFRINSEPELIETHDGMRTLGAHLKGLALIRRERSAKSPEKQFFLQHHLARTIAPSDRNTTLVLPDDNISLYYAGFLVFCFQEQGYKLRVLDAASREYELRRPNNTVRVTTVPLEEFYAVPLVPDAAASELIIRVPVSFWQNLQVRWQYVAARSVSQLFDPKFPQLPSIIRTERFMVKSDGTLEADGYALSPKNITRVRVFDGDRQLLTIPYEIERKDIAGKFREYFELMSGFSIRMPLPEGFGRPEQVRIVAFAGNEAVVEEEVAIIWEQRAPSAQIP